jgi:nucleotide-binding universal stress UspA family protein
MTIHHILIPLDFSPYAEHALDYAVTLAQRLQARVTLLHVIQIPAVVHVKGGIWPSSTFLHDLEAQVTRNMEVYLTWVTVAGLEGEYVIVQGIPFQEIIETTKARQVDIIVMGTHGRTGLSHALLGSVAERVVRLAPCPVLVARQPPPVTSAEGGA